MKYIVRGLINTVEDAPIIAATLSEYSNDVTTQDVEENGVDALSFTAATNEVLDKMFLFDNLKMYVDTFGGWIDWHICNHGEPDATPCIIVETYTGV